MDSLIQSLVQQGGFGILAGAAIWVGWAMSKKWTDDLKAAAERERLLFAAALEREKAFGQHMLEALIEVRSALTNLADEVAGLRNK